MLLTLRPDERANLLQRFKKMTSADLDWIVISCERFLHDNVAPEYLTPATMPPKFHALPVLKVNAIYSTRAAQRHAGSFAMWQVIHGFSNLPKG